VALVTGEYSADAAVLGSEPLPRLRLQAFFVGCLRDQDQSLAGLVRHVHVVGEQSGAHQVERELGHRLLCIQEVLDDLHVLHDFFVPGEHRRKVSFEALDQDVSQLAVVVGQKSRSLLTLEVQVATQTDDGQFQHVSAFGQLHASVDLV